MGGVHSGGGKGGLLQGVLGAVQMRGIHNWAVIGVRCMGSTKRAVASVLVGVLGLGNEHCAWSSERLPLAPSGLGRTPNGPYNTMALCAGS